MTEQDIDTRIGVAAAAATLVRDQLTTPRPARHLRTPALPWRHLAPLRAGMASLIVVLLLTLLAPLLLLTAWTPGSPSHLLQDPAVRALLAFEQHPDQAGEGLLVKTLPDGSLRAAREGRAGRCYYALVPAQADRPPSGVRVGTRLDCQP